MGASYNAECMEVTIQFRDPIRKPIDVSKRSWDKQMRREREGKI